MEKELRKRENMLAEAGAGVIMLAIWSLAKTNLFLGLSTLSFDDLYRTAAEINLSETFFTVCMIIIIAGVLIWQLSIRMYIGLSANAEGKGKTKGRAYLVMAAIMLISDFQLNLHAFNVKGLLAGEKLSANEITGICIELASMYVMLELLISGIRVKRLRKKMKE